MTNKKRLAVVLGATVIVVLGIGVVAGFAMAPRFAERVPRFYVQEGPSMEPAIRQAERFVAVGVRDPADLRRGDVIVFDSSDTGTPIVKRIVGLAGDVVELREGVLFINTGEARRGEVTCPRERFTSNATDIVCSVEELDGKRWTSAETIASPPSSRPPLQVPEKHLYVIGDRRDRSMDSRIFGPISFEQVRGRVKLAGDGE